jgi:hypothetical protein
MSKPPSPPPALQQIQQPDFVAMAAARKKAVGAGMNGGTLLTGPSGIANAAMNTAAPTLLGQ